MFYNIKITEYDNELQLNFYSNNIHRLDEEVKNEINEHHSKLCEQSCKTGQQSVEADFKANQIRSKRRSKQTIYNLCRANQWDYFATFTFEADRFDYESCKKRMQYFLNNFSKRRCHIEYIVVPEQHKDKAWHFHALIHGNIEPFLFKGWRKGKYRFNDFRYGINEVEKVKDSSRVSMYITKYITKELQDTLKNKRRYFASRGLKRGVESFYNVDDLNIIDFIHNNFPEYDLTYTNTCSMGECGNVKYIQLKKAVADEV